MFDTRHLVIVALILLANSVFADDAGVINFNVNKPPVPPTQRQEVNLLGCNNEVRTTYVEWDRDNQIVRDIPYSLEARISGSNKPYWNTKWYVASPPIPLVKEGEITNIGIVTPDRFVFSGENPARIVDLDYTILEPVFLQYVKVNYNYKPTVRNERLQSCAEQGVSFVPLNTSCPDFPWSNGAEGAAGVGFLKNEPGHREVFIPTTDQNGTRPLQCGVTVLNDILLDYEITFATLEGPSASADLTQAYNNGDTLQLMCVRRAQRDLPEGCAPPITKMPPAPIPAR